MILMNTLHPHHEKEKKKKIQTNSHTPVLYPSPDIKKEEGGSVCTSTFLSSYYPVRTTSAIVTHKCTLDKTKDPPHAGHIFNTDKRRILKGGGWLRILQNARGEGVRKRDREGREDFALFSPIQAQQDENMNLELCFASNGMGSTFLGLTLFPGLSLGWRKDSFHIKRERRKKGDESKCRTKTVMHRRCDWLLSSISV